MMFGEQSLRYLLRPIQELLDDPSVTEIVINRPGEVGVEIAGHWHWFEIPELTFDYLDAMGLLASRMTKRDCDRDHPFAGSTLPDGQRIQVCRPPATLSGTIAMAIRRPPTVARKVEDDDFLDLFTDTNAPISKSTAYDLQLRQLLDGGDYRRFFQLARKARKTIDCCGVTGSGKTDVQRRLIQESAAETRALTIESDHEIGPIGPRNRVNLFFNEEHPRLQPLDVIKAALRMKPDEIWFQEIRGAESWAAMRARATGHRGGGTSWHAKEGEEIDALMLMMRQYPPVAAMPDDRLRALCLQHVDIIVSCDKVPDEGFKIPKIWMKGVHQ